jgi:hypothetical protein
MKIKKYVRTYGIKDATAFASLHINVIGGVRLNCSPTMIVISIVLLLFALFAVSGGEKETQLQCNWAQNFTDFDKLLTDNAMQQQVMLIASAWEGNFAEDNFGADWYYGTTNPSVEIDPELGTGKKQVRRVFSRCVEESSCKISKQAISLVFGTFKLLVNEFFLTRTIYRA